MWWYVVIIWCDLCHGLLMDLCCSVHWWPLIRGDLRGTEAGESSLRRWPCHWCQGKASSWPWVAALSLLKERLGPDEGYLSASAHITTYSLVLWLFHHRHVPFNHVQSCSIIVYHIYIYISCIVLYRLKSCYIYNYIYMFATGQMRRFAFHPTS